MTDRIKFTVYRDKWLRGGEGVLLNEQGHRCCLGFLGQAIGCTDEEQRCVGLPQELPSADKWPKSLVATSVDDEVPYGEEPETIFCDAGPIDLIVGANDAKNVSDEEREKALTEIFARNGIDVEFRDGVGP